MTDARYYKRLDIHIPCSVFSGNNEVCGNIINICEEGLAIGLSYDDYTKIDPKTHVRLLVQFVDEIDFYSNKRLENILITADVVHSEDTGEGYIIGCKVDESQNNFDEYSRYVDLKKAISFINSTKTF